jgi:hypothetical protein
MPELNADYYHTENNSRRSETPKLILDAEDAF